MAKTLFFYLALTFLLTTAPSAEAQSSKKVSRLCYLGSSAPEAMKNLEPFHKRLRDFGYVERQNISFEYRYFEGEVERAPDLAAELVRIHCDIILTTGTEAVLAAKSSTQRIPIVMSFSGDAVQLGIVADLARPVGNTTGMTSLNNELSGKRLELLMETIPKLSRSLYCGTPLTQTHCESSKKQNRGALVRGGDSNHRG